MPWVRFTRDFRWNPPERGGRVTIAYPAGAVLLVRRCCADDAIASGAAEAAKRPERVE